MLQLAEDASVPLLERLKFAAIFTSNLDEFFMIRVAGLHDQVDAGIANTGADGRTPAETIDAIRERAGELSDRQARMRRRRRCARRWPSTGSRSSAGTRSTARSATRWTSASAARSSRC